MKGEIKTCLLLKKDFRVMRERAGKIVNRTERFKLCVSGSVSAVMAVLLIMMILYYDTGPGPVTPGGYTGTMLLGENVGDIVLVAVISFTAEVLLTVTCIRIKKKETDKQNRKDGTAEVVPSFCCADAGQKVYMGKRRPMFLFISGQLIL